MPTIVNLPSDFVNLDTLIRSISRAVTGIDWEPPQKLPDGSINIEAFKLAAAGVDWGTRIIELAKKGVLTARNPQSLQSEKWSFLDPEEAFFSIGDLNTCDRLKDGILEFLVAPVGPRPKEPGFYTLEDAAQAIATNLGWHEGARDTLKKQLMDAARTEKLTVRHPHTDAPYRPDTVRDFYELVTPADVNKWADEQDVPWRWDVPTPEPKAAPVVAVCASGVTAGPLPLPTGDIAYCFAGLRWKTEDEWKKPLGDKPKWLEACIAIPAVRGVSETHWYPVLIGAALVRQGHVSARSVRAAFQTKPLLTPWLDEWKTYEADYFATD